MSTNDFQNYVTLILIMQLFLPRQEDIYAYVNFKNFIQNVS